jgi:hypothetical protein
MDVIAKDVVDELRQQVERESEGRQTVLRTAKGQASYVNIIPREQMQDLTASLGVGTHPAFLIGGREVSEIFIGTYQAVIHDGEALSLPGEVPVTNINFDAARAACAAAGLGWHLMTNWEWAAIALWCLENNIEVRGSTCCGRSHTHPDECGTPAKKGFMTLTGSGPATWRHDHTPYGIADLVGNVWEWVDGLKLHSGKIIMPVDNNVALPEEWWPETGAVIDLVGGDTPTVSGVVTERNWDTVMSASLTTAEGYTIPPALLQAGLFPVPGLHLAAGIVWVDNNEDFEALPLRGGCWNSDRYAGLCALTLSRGRGDYFSSVGFRPAFVNL